jgi:peptidoglycan/LPS O-acetylase OafA/YrhL
MPATLPIDALAATQETAAPLSPALSLYLDAWRLLAALTVVMCHFGSQRMSGGLLWQVTPYGAQAVDVFFVLSGYVIAYAAATRETTPRRFVIGRLARLWSVAIPAVIVTFGLDAAGRVISPGVYAALPGHPSGLSVIWQAAAGLLFVNQLWRHAIPVGANIPWWSLGYEAPYYVAFYWLIFGGRMGRVLGPLVVAAIAGPTITVMSSLWFAGAQVRRQHARFGGPAAVPVYGLVAVPAIWIVYEAGCHVMGRPLGIIPATRPELAQDLLIGGLFAIHLWQAPSMLARLPPCPAVLARVIRYGASRSFALYLLHYPVMLFLRAVMVRTMPGWPPIILLPATLAICLTVGGVTEARKGDWRRLLEGVYRETGSRKVFFSEEKKQKTFATWCVPSPGLTRRMAKVLRLFFKTCFSYAAIFAPRARSPNKSSISSRHAPIGSPSASTSILPAQRSH